MQLRLYAFLSDIIGPGDIVSYRTLIKGPLFTHKALSSKLLLSRAAIIYDSAVFPALFQLCLQPYAGGNTAYAKQIMTASMAGAVLHYRFLMGAGLLT